MNQTENLVTLFNTECVEEAANNLQFWYYRERLISDAHRFSSVSAVADHLRISRALQYHQQYAAKQRRAHLMLHPEDDRSYNPNRRNKQLGLRIADAISREDAGDFIMLLDRAPSLRVAILCSTRSDWVNAMVAICDRCDEVHLSDESRDVITGTGSNTERWCRSCQCDHAAECHDCGDLVASRVAIDYGDIVLCPRCYDNGYFTCTSCDNVFHNDHYGSDGECEHCTQRYDDERRRNDGLDGYHDADRDWETYNATPDSPYPYAPPMGVEIEVWASDRNHAVMSLRDFADTSVQDTCFPSQLILEEDGSLCDTHGFECVTDPMGLTEWHEAGPSLMRAMGRNAADCKGWDAKNGVYGIHITLHRQYLGPLQEARMMMFLSTEENGKFVKAICQRDKIYHAQLDIGSVPSGSKLSCATGGLRCSCSTRNKYGKRVEQRKIYGLGKYSPINFKDNLAEFRIFQSTTNELSFMKNLDFVSALVEWTRPEACSGNSWHHKDFLIWLQNRPKAVKDYPFLTEYLQKDTFPVKHGMPIENEWLALTKRKPKAKAQ